MSMHVDHLQDKSIIKFDHEKILGSENEAFQNHVQVSIKKGCKSISVDLSNVKYMASWGIGMLIQGYKTCTSQDVKFNVTKVNPPVMKVFNQLKLTELFDID